MIHLIDFSEQLQQEKYRLPGEDYLGMCNRHAAALADGEDHRRALKEILLDGRFTLAGRPMASVGNPDPDMTAHNCYMSDTIKDNLTGKGGIYWRLLEAAKTMSMGGGVGFDFSTLRPFDGIASGPVSFMSVYSAMCHNVSRGGKKGRGAMMAMLRVDHPEIMKFITCKRPPAESQVLYELISEHPEMEGELRAILSHLMPLTGFNCSIYVTDEFMEAVEGGKTFKLRFKGKIHSEVDAQEMWECIMRNTWEFGDPGIFFGDTANRLDNLHYLPQRIVGTNPCAEKPFRRDMSCLLGSFNLTRYRFIDSYGDPNIDIPRLREDIPHIVRALDNIVDLSNYPLPGQERAARGDRQLGIGVMGMANAIESLLGPPIFGSPTYLNIQDRILSNIRDYAYQTSIELAKEKGTFPFYDPIEYPQGEFIKTLPPHIREGIERDGVRNSHLLSIAPTGTIALAYNNISTGIEPTFAKKQQRVIRRNGENVITTLEDYGVKMWGTNPKTALECSIDDHLNVLLHAQRYVDSAVSKTCNVPHNTPWEQFKDIYMRAWKGGAKGITTFTSGGKKEGIITSLDIPSCSINERGEKSCE